MSKFLLLTVCAFGLLFSSALAQAQCSYRMNDVGRPQVISQVRATAQRRSMPGRIAAVRLPAPCPKRVQPMTPTVA